MYTAFIQNLPLFASLPQAEIQRLAEVMQPSEFPAGAILFHEGDVGSRFSIILSGEIEIIKALGSPEQFILAVMLPGEYLGEMSLLDPNQQRAASARARTHVQLLEMTQDSFNELIHHYPDLGVDILRQMSIRLRETEDTTIRDLREKNRQLSQAYLELQAAQAQLIEKEKLEHELDMARRIQENILPKAIPSLSGWELAAFWQPAHAVSGDFYDFIPLIDGRLAVIIGDVTGKGVPAALVMATTCSILRAATKNVVTPGEILAHTNDVLCTSIPPGMFVTCLVAAIDQASGQVRFANAGHPLPYLLTPINQDKLRATGMPLGLMPDQPYEEKEAVLQCGDRLVLFSDGLLEAHDPGGDMFGDPRLQTQLAQRPANQLVIPYLQARLSEFTGPAWEQEDDVTFVTVERLPAEQVG
jgi:serine phosphatase RsbU (regulator of sigma subunit)